MTPWAVTVWWPGPGAPVLAHAGPGSAWQAMVVVAAVILAGFVVAAAMGRYDVGRPDDLVVPLATAAVLSGLAPVVHEVVSDAFAWSLPVGVVALAALVVAALTPLRLRWPSPLAIGALVVAAVGVAALGPPLAEQLHAADPGAYARGPRTVA